jgi:molybdopterin converting factor small subunit
MGRGGGRLLESARTACGVNVIMPVRVLFFGATADAAGTRSIELDVDAPRRAGDLFSEIVDRYPKLAGHSLLFAVNQQYADSESRVGDGDELAVFTAVSGG